MDAEENQLTRITSYIKAYTTISRFEYWPGVAPGLLIPLLLGLDSLEQMLSPVVIEMIVLCVLLYFSGFIINSLVDRELDKKYQTFKTSISESVEFLGVERVKQILFVQVVMAVILGMHISFVLNNIWILILLGFGIIFGLGYSAKPFYFKVKGIWHAISLASSAFFIPLMFIYLVVAKTIEILDILLILGITIAHYSLAMANQAADHMEDTQEGVLTPTVRFGLERTLKWSLIMTTAGMAFIMFLVGIMYVNSGYSIFLGLEVTGLPAPAMVLLLAMVAVIIGTGYFVPLKGLKDLYDHSIEPIPLNRRMERIKSRINYASWQASGAIGLAVVLGLLFIGSLNTTVVTNDEQPLTASELDISNMRISNVEVTTGNEGNSNNYADVVVRLPLKDIEDPDALRAIQALVEAGTANSIFETSQNYFDTDGRSTIRVNLQGNNESEVWYFVHLMYKDQISSYTWTEPSSSKLYIFDADLTFGEDGLLYQHIELSVSVFNAGQVREPDSVSIKVEWTPLQYNWSSNEVLIQPQQVWETQVTRDVLKEWLSESSTLKIYLYYNDNQFDIMEIDV